MCLVFIQKDFVVGKVLYISLLDKYIKDDREIITELKKASRIAV